MAIRGEKQALERYWLDLATLYAGAAHKTSTALTTSALILGDLRRSDTPPPDWKQRIDLLGEQIEISMRALSELVLLCGVEPPGKPRSVSAEQLVHEVGKQFRTLLPTVQFKLRVRLDDSLTLKGDGTLSHALLHFLNNAAAASPHSVGLCAGRKDDTLVIHVLDRGPGVASHLREHIGEGPHRSSAPGCASGAGMLIAQAIIERFGGAVRIFDRSGGGTCVQVELPMSRSTGEKSDEYRQLRIASG